MKRFGSLVFKRSGETVGNNDALHARVGKYVKILAGNDQLTPMSDRIIRSSISVFEAFNPIRNDKSLAHDNEDLVNMDEARFIFDSVTAILRFFKALDADLFEDQ
ncbi:abortive infection family protein [Shimia sp. W99]